MDDKKDDITLKQILQDKAVTNALSIENAMAEFSVQSLNKSMDLDKTIETLVDSVEQELPNMNVNEKLNAIRTLASIRNSQASTVFNAMNSDSAGTTLLERTRDREAQDADAYEKVFQSVKHKTDLAAGLANLGKLMELLSKPKGGDAE